LPKAEFFTYEIIADLLLSRPEGGIIFCTGHKFRVS
jgi:hypothetical protein